MPRVAGGIPSSLRHKVWLLISGALAMWEEAPNLYVKLLAQAQVRLASPGRSRKPSRGCGVADLSGPTAYGLRLTPAP